MTTKHCMRDEVLLSTLELAGLEQVFILPDDTDVRAWLLAVKLSNSPELVYLSSRRVPHSPRPFKTIEAAINAGKQFFPPNGRKNFTVVID